MTNSADAPNPDHSSKSGAGPVPIRLDTLRKVQSAGAIKPGEELDGSIEAIVKVNRADYTPANITVRARIDPFLFTCEMPADELEKLENDPGVESVALSQKLRTDDNDGGNPKQSPSAE